MKKWPIFATLALMLVLCAVVFGACGTQPQQQAEQASETETTVCTETAEPTTLPPETTVATEPPIEPVDESLLHAKHVFVYDITDERLLYTYGDQTETISPASLTKLFTCYVALQYLDPAAVVEVGEEADWIEPDSSVAAVFPGTRLTVEMIVQGAIMQSGNDAAYALAVAAGRQIAADPQMEVHAAFGVFMEEMNRQAQMLGLTGSHFVTPDGYDEEGHYTTAQDMMTIARLAMTQPLIVRYAKVPKAVVTFESGENYTWQNTNWLLREDKEDYYCPEAVGLKTGATSNAGKCVIAVFDTGEKVLLVGVFGCEELEHRFGDALLLYEYYMAALQE